MTLKQQLPPSIDPKRYSVCLLGPLALGLSVGMQITMTAFMVLGPARALGFPNQLTKLGKTVVRPEHDLLIYAAGVLLALLAALVTLWCWRYKLARVDASRGQEFQTCSALLEGLLAVTSLGVYALLLASRWFSRDFQTARPGLGPPMEAADAVMMLVPCAVALICAALDPEYGFCQSAASAGRFEHWRLRLGKLLRYAVPVFIILVVGVPPGTWPRLVGQIFLTDDGHHLNFFMMGPALSFAHGRAFGTEIYSQYGIGWPMLASALSHLSALTYANLVGLEIVYGCVYYLALFFLLRSCFKQELWAAFGLVLAVYWQVFSGMGPGGVIWQTPSSTMMRHPMDVWFFLALVMHQRSGRIIWAVASGFAGALGIFFETETGVYLLATFLTYAVLQTGLSAVERRAGGAKSWLLPPLAFYSTVAVTLLPLLLYASRGTLCTSAFWHGWVEALVAYAGQGVGALPIAGVPDAPLIIFMIMVTGYLVVIAYAAARALQGSASRNEVLLAALAAYGLALLLLFVNRSHPFNLCHAATPFAILLTALLFRGCKALANLLPRSSFPYALAGGLVLLLFAKPEFQRYPSFLGSIFAHTPSGGVAFRSNPTDISGLPPAYEDYARELKDICSAIRTLAPDGKGVAILDPHDTLLYSVSNASPWSRYASLFHMAVTQQALDGLQSDLLMRSPRYVVIRGQNAARSPSWDFVWAPLYAVVTNRYVLHQTVGSYEIWQRSNHS